MKPTAPPAIDSRTSTDIAAEVTALLAKYTAYRRAPSDPPDPGRALIRIFAHFAGIVIDRLNRAPDKAFLAFLNLIGVTQLPPQPARVPLTFHLAQGATGDARVPAGTRVGAAAQEGEADPPVFETTDELFLTGAELVAAFVHDPARDAWQDLPILDISAGPDAGAQGFPAFSGDTPIERRLWIADPIFSGQTPRDVTLTISAKPADAKFPDMEWGWWDGIAWQEIAKPSVRRQNGGITLTFKALPPVPVATAVSANGVPDGDGAWIGGRLPPQDPASETLVLAPQQISAIKASMAVGRDKLPPDAVFSGPVAIDASKDFLPFGERPKLGDFLMLACNEAFASAGPADSSNQQTITITFTASDVDQGRLPAPDPAVQPDGKVALTWEYCNGSRWRALGRSNETNTFVKDSAEEDFKFADATQAFMAMPRNGTATVSFRRPADWMPSAVAGQTSYWLRARISSGEYGRDATYRSSTTKDADGHTVQEYVFQPATWRPPSLRLIDCAYTYTSPVVTPQRVLIEGNFQLTDQTAAIATRGLTVALAPPATDTRPAIYLGFRRPGAIAAFANQPVSLYVGVAEVFEHDLSHQHLHAATKPPEVAWEYQTSLDWRWLGAQDETAGLTRRGLLTFIGPADLGLTIAFGQEACWLRARWDSGEYVVAPSLYRIVTNTIWAHHATRFENEVLGSGTSEPGQVFNTTSAPVLDGQGLEVAETEPPPETEVAPGDVTIVRDENGGVIAVWVRWQEVPHFYGSQPDSRHYTIDRLSGTIAFGGNGRGRTPPRGSNNVRISYLSGGGSVGNRPAGNITQMKSAIPYIDAVINLEEAAGGADMQDVDEARRRGPTVLRHQHRAVAIADYEDLAFEASPAIARAKGLQSHDSDDAGHVDLIVVPLGTETQPAPSLELLRQVQDYVTRRAPPTVDLAVRGPIWLAVSVTVEIAPVSFTGSMELRSAVLDRLAAFLHPLTGGLDGGGWEFGRSPHRSDLYAMIEGIPGVDHIRALTVSVSSDSPPVSDATLVHAGAIDVVLAEPPTSGM